VGGGNGPEVRARRVLQFEQSLRHNNRAVVGGIEAFASRLDLSWGAWAEAVRAALTGYGAKSPAARARAIAEAIEAIDGAPTGSGVRPAPSSRASTRPVTTPASGAVDCRQSPGEALYPKPVPTPTSQERRGATSRVPTARGRATAVASPPPPPITSAAPSDAVTLLPDLDSRALAALQKLGVVTLEDLAFHLPKRHVDRRSVTPVAELVAGQVANVLVTVVSVNRKPTSRRGLTVTQATIRDESGYAQVTWFNQAYLLRRLGQSNPVLISGRAELTPGGAFQFTSPDYEFDVAESLHAGRLVPFYAKSEGLTDKVIRTAVRKALDVVGDKFLDLAPPRVRHAEGLPPVAVALGTAHFPESVEDHAKALERLAFDELLGIQTWVLQRRYQRESERPAAAFDVPVGTVADFEARLPYTLTGAQRRVIAEIEADVRRPVAMGRLLQGEVGSGKTAVAAAACLMAVRSGYQVAFMAPTDILAQQHERGLVATLAPLGVRVARVTGSQRLREKRQTWLGVQAGLLDVIVGTHALIEESGSFANLGLVVVDEQHRFGVRQRQALVGKGTNPHMLAMTATPIPRTLALSVFGDLELSLLDELPPGRQPIRTILVRPERRSEAYEYVRTQVKLGRQAFVIFPLVEESERVEARAATAEFERLRRQFPDLRLALVHGRLTPREKDEVMARFRDGQADVLVATAVVEVGIDVPNASVILIEGADRFGLAQLHQFRGRVGRGPHASSCLLLTESDAETTLARLRALERTSNGFALAEEDLRMRGPGQFFGTRQSGLPDLRVASYGDRDTLIRARRQAASILKVDPALALPEHAPLATQVALNETRSMGAG
jgi:ATP-dependent DNA helicase RecG